MAFNPLCLPPDKTIEIEDLLKRLRYKSALTRDRNDGSFVFYYPKNNGRDSERLVISDYATLVKHLKYVIEEERTTINV